MTTFHQSILLNTDIDEILNAKAQVTPEPVTPVIAVYAPDRVHVQAEFNGTVKTAEFTSSQVVAALAALGHLPTVGEWPIRYTTDGGTKTVDVPCAPDCVWSAPCDYIAEEFGNEFADSVVYYLHSNHPEAWTWEPKF